MPVSLLDSQLATLEPLEPDERGAVIDATPPLDVVIENGAVGGPVLGRLGRSACRRALRSGRAGSSVVRAGDF